MAMERRRQPTDSPKQEGEPATWAVRLRRGEPEAVVEVRKRVARILRHGALALPPEAREDLEQEVMADLWQAVNRRGFDAHLGFWGFVEVVTSRRCIDWLRGHREQAVLPAGLEAPGRGPLGHLVEKERTALAREVLGRLRGSCRELILLRLRDDLGYGEIARRLGKSEGALRIQMYRCVRAARRLLRRLGATPEADGDWT